MGAVFLELVGFLAICFVAFLFVSGFVVIAITGLFLPLMMPLLIPGFVLMSVLALLGVRWNAYLDSL